MKLLAALLEDDENMVIIPLYWLSRQRRMELIRDGYEVIPIPGYQETDGFRAFKIIGPYNVNVWLIKEFSIPIWQDWKLTAQSASRIERSDSTTGQQMFDRLDDDEEKIQAFKYEWYPDTRRYIIKYFEDHLDLLKRAKNSLKREEIHDDFKKLFYQ